MNQKCRRVQCSGELKALVGFSSVSNQVKRRKYNNDDYIQCRYLWIGIGQSVRVPQEKEKKMNIKKKKWTNNQSQFETRSGRFPTDRITSEFRCLGSFLRSSNGRQINTHTRKKITIKKISNLITVTATVMTVSTPSINPNWIYRNYFQSSTMKQLTWG